MSQEDRAQEQELLHWERRNNRLPTTPEYQPMDKAYGPSCCEECEDEMPAVRRSMGKRLCTTCQERQDRQTRFRM